MTSAADHPTPPRSNAPRHHFRPPDPADVVYEATSEDDVTVQGPLPPRPWYALVAGQWPLFITMLTVLAGIAVGYSSHWRAGSTLAGAGFVLGALLRALVPERIVGLLACRSRWADVAFLVLVGVGVIVLAWLIDPSPR